MKITLCGSMVFFDGMLECKRLLEEQGHEVRMPPTHVEDDHGNKVPVKEYHKIRHESDASKTWVWEEKEKAMRDHFDKVSWADSILVLNYDKKSVSGYVGANTLIEMGLALHLGKKIFLLKEIPELSYKEEILGMKPEIIDGDLKKIK
ncbi:hypothetical protein ACFLZB_02975 [Nanoarchaeota archaeon]